MWPGPTIVARRGRPVVVTQVNQLDHTTTTHNHGHKVEAASDGHPANFLMPGASRDYHYPNDQPAGTYWLHDHVMNDTQRNVLRGLSSFYIIKDDEWDSLNLPSGEFDVPLLIQDRWMNGDGTLRQGKSIGDIAVVNGVETPRMEVAARKYLFRLLNASSDRSYIFEFQADNPDEGRDAPRETMAVVASDGGLLEHPVLKQQIQVSPAERYAVVVDFSKFPVGTTVTMRNRLPIPPQFTTSTGAPRLLIPDIMTFVVTRKATDDTGPIPQNLRTIEHFDPAKADVSRSVVFSDVVSADPDFPIHEINGKEFDPGRIDFHGKLGQTEIWTVDNETAIGHILHVHLVQFQVIESDDAPPPPEMAGWKDSIFIASRTRAKIMLRWEGFTGVYVFHCHYLEHEDHGMMAQVEVSQ